MCSPENMRGAIPTCDCLIGFYDNGSAVCQSCDYRCLSCLDAQTCSTCDSLMNRFYNNLTQMCDCMPVYYDSGLNSMKCVSCSY
jgi:proprotein convertase subtilisin/kexin type 5